MGLFFAVFAAETSLFLQCGVSLYSQSVSADVHHQLQGRVPVLGGFTPRAALVVHVSLRSTK